MQPETETTLNSGPAPLDDILNQRAEHFSFSPSLETAVFMSSVPVS